MYALKNSGVKGIETNVCVDKKVTSSSNLSSVVLKSEDRA